MPEGDSLHRVAARLRPLVGLHITATSPHPRGLVTGVAAAVDGRRLEGVEAVGKIYCSGSKVASRFGAICG